jgi:hypothetical protein
MSIPEEVWNAAWHGNWQHDEGKGAMPPNERLSLILVRSKSGVMPEILPHRRRPNNPKLLDEKSELPRVLVRFNHGTRFIVNANDGAM